MTLAAILAFLVTGAFAGLLGGLLGIGGGLIVVPLLVLIFHLMDLPSTYSMQVAIGTSLGAMVFTSGSAAWAHIKKRCVVWHIFWYLVPGVVIGAILGALIADYLPGKELKLIFGLFVIVIGCYFIIASRLSNREEEPYNFHKIFWSLFGIGIGALSSIMGIGGGLLTVPLLTTLKTPIRYAISTSAVVGFVIASIGAFSFLYLGLGVETFPESFGYLYVPAFITIGLASSLAAPFGVQLAFILHTTVLKQIFGGVLIMIGSIMVLS